MMRETLGFVVRRVKAADLDLILEIENACFGADAYDRNTFAYYLRRPQDVFLAVWRDGQIWGYTLAYVARERAEVVSVAVRPEARRRGVAKALMNSLLRRLAGRGIQRVALMVRVSNREAQALYASYGFQTVRLVRRYYDDGADGWLMHLKQ